MEAEQSRLELVGSGMVGRVARGTGWFVIQRRSGLGVGAGDLGLADSGLSSSAVYARQQPSGSWVILGGDVVGGIRGGKVSSSQEESRGMAIGVKIRWSDQLNVITGGG